VQQKLKYTLKKLIHFCLYFIFTMPFSAAAVVSDPSLIGRPLKSDKIC
jgi:hypothetical protein